MIGALGEKELAFSAVQSLGRTTGKPYGSDYGIPEPVLIFGVVLYALRHEGPPAAILAL